VEEAVLPNVLRSLSCYIEFGVYPRYKTVLARVLQMDVVLSQQLTISMLFIDFHAAE